ncbi:MAG: hypothetical protein NC043_08645 [Muribaculaceae bacterium]|nr:hypothetical protein [Muribaculaceae bacterium]
MERMPIIRMDSVIMALSGRPDLSVADSIANRYRPAVNALMVMAGTEGKMAADSFLIGYASSDAMRVFGADIRRRVPPLDGVEREIGESLGKLQRMDSAMSVPSVAAGVVIPYMQSVVRVDSVLLIGLNHYLGADYEGYAGFDGYKRVLKEPTRIVYDAVEAVVAGERPYRGGPDATVLSRMLYEGALLNVLLSVIPGADEASVLGYGGEQMRWAHDNEGKIWEAMASRDMLYSTDASLAARLVAPAPGTPVVHQEAPGRIGRFIGLRIVEQYCRNNPDVSPADLLHEGFYASPSALKKAGYRP